jgi:uncharacterized protein YjbI with pentapeptide repeats
LGLWIIGIVGAVIFVAAVIPGMLLWWPTRSSPDARGGFGVSLVTGAVVALAIFSLQMLFEIRLDHVDQERQKQADRQNLELTIGLQRELPGIQLNGLDLKSFYFYDKNLRDANFTAANLKDATLTASDLSCAKFTGANLTDVTGQRVHLRGTAFDRAKLAGAVLNGADQEGTSCAGHSHTNFGGAFLASASLDGVRLEETDFRNANLSSADLSSSHLARSNFAGARLKGADLENADLQGADLSGAELTRATLTGAAYDSHTLWPKHFEQLPCRVGKTCRAR